ncbi:MAG: prephenate dehydrogenase [Lachnospiraceae bacterium]|nr:prephenate dehydrogenase [Lachnospiraceae bacterium]
MEWINKSRILIVGLGLMGGSYAMALKRIGYHVDAVDKDEGAIRYALDKGIIDEGAVSPSKELIGSADTVIFALYPGLIIPWIKDNQKFFKPGITITDVTGIKNNIVYKIQDILRKDVEFIAAHPMAGREISGVTGADGSIFRDANYIVVPTERNTDRAIKWCSDLGGILGCRKVSVLTPQEHDRMIAYVSQLTHCIAVALMTCNDNEKLVDYTGDSFRDLTRIARINEDMWSELFLMNKKELLHEMDAFLDELKTIREYIDKEDTDALKDKMRLSTKRRERFNR